MPGISNSITNKMTPLTLPTKLHFIKNQSLAQVFISQISTLKTVLFLEEDLAQATQLLPIIKKFSDTGQVIWINAVPSDLTLKAILQVLKSLEHSEIDQFLAIGDDKVLDLAKSVALCHLPHKKISSEKSVLDHLRKHKNHDHLERASLKAILTTPQCASALMGRVSVIQASPDSLVVLKNPSLSYDEAIIFMDESIVLSPLQILTSGLKALSQATEAFWSKENTPSIQQLSLSAIKRVITTLPILLKKPDHHEAREQMMIGSLMAAFVNSNTPMAACSSIGLTLNWVTKMDLGVASALALPELLRHNLGAIKNPESLYEAFNINNPEDLGLWIENCAKGLLSVRLNEYGVKEEDVAHISAQILDLGFIANNAIELSNDHLSVMLKRHL